jgi:putative chitinase
MSLVTRDLLETVMTEADPAKIDLYLPHLVPACAEFHVDTPLRVAAFVATLAEETGQLATVSEILNYSATGLANTWPSRYAKVDADGEYVRDAQRRYVPNDLALDLHRQPERIANHCYANRMGNRDVASGDGWRFRGAGGIQETGRDNHYAAALFFDIELDAIGDWLRSPEGAMRSAAWGFERRGCNRVADRGDFDGVCDLINLGHKTARIGDANGYAHRLAFYQAARKALSC